MPSYCREQFEKAIPGSAGIISAIAQKVGCDWHTAKKWIERDDGLQQMVTAELEASIDIAEASLLSLIKEKDLQAIKFFLKTKGKHRGYVETSRVEGTWDIKRVDVDKLSDEQLAAIASGKNPDAVFSYEE